jgi:alpha-mannosidase
MVIVHMIGNAHIDPAWLWRWQAGADETLATFRSAADRCDEYPDFIFTRGEAWTYKQVERLDPVLFARVRRLVERGQWHITGGQWIQPDANLPTEMGWRRQLLHGQRYFTEHFGVRPTIAYQVDTFGHPATLPDLLSEMGYIGYVFHRPDPHQLKLPAHTFRWRGPRGGEVLGMRLVPGYVTRTDELREAIQAALAAANPGLGHVMCFYGVGNHGGGPTKASIEYILEHRHAFPGATLRFSTPQAFAEAIAPYWEELPVVTTELQHTFPGCYSVMHDIKQQQRAGEHLLAQSERVIEVYACDEQERVQQTARLDAAWNDLLLTEFHDILAGTCIPSAWRSVRAMQGRACITGEEIIHEVTRRWARRQLPALNEHQVIVLNPDSAPWEGLLEVEPHLDFDQWGARWLSNGANEPLVFQHVSAEALLLVNRIIFPIHVAPGGSAHLVLRSDPPPADLPAIETDLEVSPQHLANQHLSIELSRSGIAQIRVDGRTLLEPGGITLQLRQDSTDTWTFHTDTFKEPVLATFTTDGWIVEETGPLRARVRAEGWLGHSRIRWTLSLERAQKRLTMQVDVGFNERFTLLQLPIQLTSEVVGWRDGQVTGSVERQPNGAEWPVQGWSQVTLANGLRAALVTQDAYSLSLNERHCWQWTLLRSPKMAWAGDTWGGEAFFPSVGHDHFTDQGEHSFTFTLLVGDEQESSLEEQALHISARQQAQPPIVFDRYEGMNRPPWGNTPPPHLR